MSRKTTNKRIFITGATGLLGSVLADTLKDEGYEVITKRVEITDAKACRDFAGREKKFDFVIHAAGEIDVSKCEKDQRRSYAINVLGTRNVRGIAETSGARLIYISTAAIFSGFEGNYKETDTPYPKNFYSLTKLLGEQITLEYSKGYVVRLNITGIHKKGSRGRNFVEWLMDCARFDKDVKLFTDILVNPLSNLTLSDMIARIIKKGDSKEKVLHLGSKNPLSKAEIGKIIFSYFPKYRGEALFVKSDDVVKDAAKPKEMWLNTELAEKTLGIRMPMLESELDKVLQRAKIETHV